jgi:hypothetical protein
MATGPRTQLQADATLERQCPHCGAWQTGDDSEARCRFCDGALARADRRLGDRPVLKLLIRLAQGYRHWSAGALAVAVVHLLRVGGAESIFVGFLVLVPFSMALAIAYLTRGATSRWLVAFLVLVDLGIILAPAHGIFPRLNLFPQIARTQSRILSWYMLVYATLQFGVAPPVAFGRSLHTAWRGGKPGLAPWICILGLAVWGLLASIVCFGVFHEP